jgi:phosphatidate cytidylyltransferase
MRIVEGRAQPAASPRIHSKGVCMTSAFSTLGSRTAVAVFGIPIVLGSLYFGGIPLLLLSCVVETVALFELAGLAAKKGYAPLRVLPAAAVAVFNADIHFYNGGHAVWILFVSLFLIAVLELFRGKPHSLANVSSALFGSMYMSFFSFYMLIHRLPSRLPETGGMDGGSLLLLVYLTIWICDTAAYFIGARFGKYRLFPRVSPKKTWEGAAAGFLAAIVIAVCLRRPFAPMLTTIQAVALGLLIGVLSQVGDLFESLLKRDAGTKDSSNLLPGHGGMLDRFDSPMFLAPVLYAFFRIWVF